MCSFVSLKTGRIESREWSSIYKHSQSIVLPIFPLVAQQSEMHEELINIHSWCLCSLGKAETVEVN